MRWWRLLVGRLRLFWWGARREEKAIARWQVEYRRVRDGLHRFVGCGLGPSLDRIAEWRTAEDGQTIVMVGVSRREWMVLLESLYGTDHPTTERHRRALMRLGP
jgi:hypothetical protein